MPSTAVQSRIAAFESIAAKPHPNGRSVDTPRQTVIASPSPSPPNLGRKTSLVDLKDWIVDDGSSVTGFAQGRAYYPPTKGQVFDAKRQLIAPLIQLQPPPRPRVSSSSTGTAPPLPPRKPSLNSLKSSASSASLVSLGSNNGAASTSRRSDSLTVNRVHTYPPPSQSLPKNIPKHAPASSISSFHSVSLSSDTDPSTPCSLSNHIATFPMDHDTERALRGTDRCSEADSISLSESYEEVSTPSLASPTAEQVISHDWAKVIARRSPVPPKLPQRPSSATSSSSSAPGAKPLRSPPSRPSSSKPDAPFPIPSTISTSTTYPAFTSASRRTPPPPPPASRSTNRSSIQSLSSNYSSHTPTPYHPGFNKAKRPTPVPATARVRYIAVFNANVLQQCKVKKQKEKEKPPLLSPTEAKKTRQAAGWRGLSVDLITGGEGLVAGAPSSEDEEPDDDPVDGTERLDGHVINAIWRLSKLDRTKLRHFWNECDPSGTGSLDQDGFVKGMWRIDEELRRVSRQALESASIHIRSAYKPSNQLPKPLLP